MRPLPAQLFAGPATSSAAGFLSIERVGKDYPSAGGMLMVLDGLTLALAERELAVLLGPSGCGKSTLLRLVAGLEAPSRGRLLLAGQEITGPSRERGMVFQSYTSFPWLTVQQNVEYGLRLHGETLSLQEGTADYFLERVGLAKFRHAYPEQLSGGMRQRVAIARALATYPRLLLMDEPFGALDAETRWQMQELLLEVATKERMTVLIVTHDIDEALFLGDRIFFLARNPGRIRETIEPAFKQTARVTNKEALYDADGYRELERHIMRLLRDEAARD